jgi:hypothetical protein
MKMMSLAASGIQYPGDLSAVIRCLPAILRLHVRTARDNGFPAASPPLVEQVNCIIVRILLPVSAHR